MGVYVEMAKCLIKESELTSQRMANLVDALEKERGQLSSIVNLLMTQMSVKLSDKEFKEIAKIYQPLRWYFSRDNVSVSVGEKNFKDNYMEISQDGKD